MNVIRFPKLAARAGLRQRVRAMLKVKPLHEWQPHVFWRWAIAVDLLIWAVFFAFVWSLGRAFGWWGD